MSKNQTLSNEQRTPAGQEFDRDWLKKSFGRLNGNHSFKEENPGAYVEYAARRRPGGKVAYFNLPLALEMGLVRERDGESSNSISLALQKILLDTFSLTIINEWDLQQGVRFSKNQRIDGRFMATRYLQLQHPTRQGKTSGDGRGIWNGEVTHRGVTWDVTSSGTGATRLSPATAKTGKFFRSGDPRVCYGNGYNSLNDGLAAALMSEALHHEGFSTERTLAIISYRDGSSINVRAGKNLIRPAHLFRPLKQGDLPALKQLLNTCMARESQSMTRAGEPKGTDWFFAKVSTDFACAAARYRSDYVFCWFDWDGDNILCDGGIIDYGSIRKFGAYHKGYRYDDGDRFSTRIWEQVKKARYIVQTFAQMDEFVKTGVRPALRSLADHKWVQNFDREYAYALRDRLLWKVGLTQEERTYAREKYGLPESKAFDRFEAAFRSLEELQCLRGVKSVSDGEVSHGVFRMSVFLREYPRLVSQHQELLGARYLSELCRTEYASRRDLKVSPSLSKRWKALEESYRELMRTLAHQRGESERKKVLSTQMRASLRNPDVGVTGDGALAVTEKLLKGPVSQIQELTSLWSEFFRERWNGNTREALKAESTRKDLTRLIEILSDYRQGV